MSEIASRAEITPANARFLTSPVPVVIHIVTAAVYIIVGAFQFVPGVRRRRPGWHRSAGRLLVAIRRGEVSRHRAWMARAYAIGLGAGTQVLTLGIGEALAGPPTGLTHALLVGAGWAINLGVAEWAIRRSPILTAGPRVPRVMIRADSGR